MGYGVCGARYGVWGMGWCNADSAEALVSRYRVRGAGSWVPETGQPIGFLVKLSSRIGPPGGPSMRDPESG